MLHAYRSGAGEPLLLVHGLGVHWRVWEPLLSMLEPGFDVLAPDLPGFGESPQLPDGVRPDLIGLTDALERAMDDAGFATAHVAGNSLGGLLALELARRGRARTVCAFSPAGQARGWEDTYVRTTLRALRALARALRQVTPVAARSAVLRTLTLGLVAGRPWRMEPDWAADLGLSYASSPGFVPVLRAFRLDESDAYYARIRCPVVIAWGSRDRLLFPRQGPRFARTIPGARLVLLRGLGHAPMSDDPRLVAEVIRRTATLGR
jgi:pimeloyl-ACP methyl ester carboxylesterase